MQRLNIPFSRNTKTTRQSRRVVWTLCVCLFLLILSIHFVTVNALTSPSLISNAPTDTEFAFNFNVNPKTHKYIDKIFKDIPLISHRSITFSDLSPYINGQIGLFIGSDFSRSIVIRTSNQELPLKLLDAHSISVQKIDSHTVVLSEKLMPISSQKRKAPFFSSFPTTKGAYIGTMFSKKDKKGSPIYANENELLIKLQKTTTNIFPRQIHDNTVAFTSFESADDEVRAYIEQISYFIEPLTKQNFSSNLSAFFAHPGGILLTKSDDSLKFLLFSEANIKQDERAEMIQSIIAVNNPTIVETSLEDGSIIKELIADPAIVPVEMLTISGQSILHATSSVNSNAYISAYDEILFSNDEALINFWLSIQQKNDTKTFCMANVAGIELKKINELFNAQAEFVSEKILDKLAEVASIIGVEQRKNSTFLHICY